MVRERDKRHSFILIKPQVLTHLHHVDRDFCSVERDKDIIDGLFRVKKRLPGAFEVNRIREDDSRVRTENAFGDQVLDPVGGMVGHPTIDSLTRGLGLIAVIQRLGMGIIPGPDRLRIFRKHRIAHRRPDRVGRTEDQLPFLLDAIQSPDQLAKQRMGRRLLTRKLKNIGHLVGGLAARPRPGHAKGRGNAPGRYEDIARRLAGGQFAKNVQGEAVVARNQVCGLLADITLSLENRAGQQARAQ
jgi:hypothetical protein